MESSLESKYPLHKRIKAFIKSFEVTYFNRQEALFQENLSKHKPPKIIHFKKSIVSHQVIIPRPQRELPQKTISLIINQNVRVEDQTNLKGLPLYSQKKEIVSKLLENLPQIKSNFQTCSFNTNTLTKALLKELTRQAFRQFFLRESGPDGELKLVRAAEIKELVSTLKQELKELGVQLEMKMVDELCEFWVQDFKRQQAKQKQVPYLNLISIQKKNLFKTVLDGYCGMCQLFYCYSHTDQERRLVSRKKFRRIELDTSFYTDEQIDHIVKNNKLFNRAFMFQTACTPNEKLITDCHTCSMRPKKLYPEQISSQSREEIEFILKAFMDQTSDTCFFSKVLAFAGFDLPCASIGPSFLKDLTGPGLKPALLSTEAYLDRKEQQMYLAKVVKWTKSDLSIEEQQEPTTCWHEGECQEGKCECIKQGSFCNRSCGCWKYCYNIFKGCNCLNSCKFHKCTCLQNNRECQSDICGKKGKACNYSTCSNMNITYGVKKELIPDISQICPGFGLYAGRTFEKDEYLCEYVGELISNSEGERRGQLADILGESYLYTLSKDQNIDAQNVGSLMKLINNAFPPMSNCRPKIIFADSGNRIALYASEKIKEGSELFFDYGYSEDKQDQLEWLREFKAKYFWMEKAGKKKEGTLSKKKSSFKSLTDDPITEE